MSVAEDLLSEMHTWRAAWRQVEIFLDRIDEMRKKDNPHAARTKALVRVFAFLQLESRWRTGWGLDLPLEMAAAGEGPPDHWSNGLFGFGAGYRTASLTDVPTTPDPDANPLSFRLPGLFEIEVAAASLSLPDGESPNDDNVKDIVLSPRHKLFTRYDVDLRDWVDVEFPIYHFGRPASVFRVDTEEGLFPRDSRINIVLSSLRTDIPPADNPNQRPPDHPKLWSNLRFQRTSADFLDLQPLNNGGSTDTLVILRDACTRGQIAAFAARTFIEREGVGPAAEMEPEAVVRILDTIHTGFAQRAALYSKMANGGGPDTDQEQALLQGNIVDPIAQLFLQYVLDESVDAQIAYPDGTLRQLRTLEWTFLMHYNARLPWFWYRRERALKPLLSRFLKGFRQSLVQIRAGEPTAFPRSYKLNRAAAVGDASLQVTGDDHMPFPDLTGVFPGQIAFLQGEKAPTRAAGLPFLLSKTVPLALQQERSTAVLILGIDPPIRIDNTIVPRLRISPLRVSLATGKEIPGSAGLIPSGGLLHPGPSGVSDEDLKAGTSAAFPGNDGTIQEIVSVWSKLCLLIGTTAVEGHPFLSVSLPSPLPRTMNVPVMGPVKAGTDRLIVRVKDLVDLGFDPKKPHFARPGEMLLLRGRAPAEDDGTPGDLWQTAVEVRGVVRVTAKQSYEDLSVVTLPCPLCCEGPGELLAVLITDPRLPVDLSGDTVLHRDFLGFGTPSLSSEHILPGVIDPDSSTLSDTVYRGPELDVAVSILKHWLGDRTAP